MLLRKSRWLLVVLLLALLPACKERKESTPNRGAAKPLDVKGLCTRYCGKLLSCGVKSSATCLDDCVTVVSAGVDIKPYTCVADKACALISNCGI